MRDELEPILCGEWRARGLLVGKVQQQRWKVTSFGARLPSNAHSQVNGNRLAVRAPDVDAGGLILAVIEIGGYRPKRSLEPHDERLFALKQSALLSRRYAWRQQCQKTPDPGKSQVRWLAGTQHSTEYAYRA
jgi:hypothetical protein